MNYKVNNWAMLKL